MNGFETKVNSIKVVCDSITLSLNDDTDIRADKPLFLAKLSNLQLGLKSFDRPDDAGTYVLKKLGIWQNRNSKLVKE